MIESVSHSKPRMSFEEAVESLRQNPERELWARLNYFDDPIAQAAERFRNSTEWQAIREYLPNTPGNTSGHTSGMALDIGAGRGIASYALAREGWQVSALEPDASHVVGAGAIRKLAKETGLDINVVEDWGESLPFADNSFDLVFCRQVLHHARDLGVMMGEIHRVLKSGGSFIGVREHVIARPEDRQTFLDAHPMHNICGGENAYVLKYYTDMIEGAGIHLTRILGPVDSNINLFPDTCMGILRRAAAKFHVPVFFATLLPKVVMHQYDIRNSAVDRLYSFIGIKP